MRLLAFKKKLYEFDLNASTKVMQKLPHYHFSTALDGYPSFFIKGRSEREIKNSKRC